MFWPNLSLSASLLRKVCRTAESPKMACSELRYCGVNSVLDLDTSMPVRWLTEFLRASNFSSLSRALLNSFLWFSTVLIVSLS